MKNKIRIITSKSSLLGLVAYIGTISEEQYQLLMKHIDYAWDNMGEIKVMFENDHMMLLEDYRDDNTTNYIRFVKSDTNWVLEIGQKENRDGVHKKGSFSYSIENGVLTRVIYQERKEIVNDEIINQHQTTIYELNDETFEVVYSDPGEEVKPLKREQEMVRSR